MIRGTGVDLGLHAENPDRSSGCSSLMPLSPLPSAGICPRSMCNMASSNLGLRLLLKLTIRRANFREAKLGLFSSLFLSGAAARCSQCTKYLFGSLMPISNPEAVKHPTKWGGVIPATDTTRPLINFRTAHGQRNGTPETRSGVIIAYYTCTNSHPTAGPVQYVRRGSKE